MHYVDEIIINAKHLLKKGYSVLNNSEILLVPICSEYFFCSSPGYE